MRVELHKRYTFEAAHRLPMVPEDHKCFRMHGHSYAVTVYIAGEVDERMGWLQDFGEITALAGPLLKRELDHRCLNDVPGLGPTAEIVTAGCGTALKPLPLLVRIQLDEPARAAATGQ
jgi:6-pyruvoyltetrahydropterin/6-carboxytetrahydropterin synthase